MKKSKNRKKVSYTLLRIVGKLQEIDSRTRYYGTDQPLHEAEIHMIKSIKENEGMHVTGLAEILGVTKGAVSQIMAKLSKKEMIIKEVDPQNQSRLKIRLTQKGEIAYIYHEQLHQKFNGIVDEILDSATDAQSEYLKKFLNSIEQKIDEFAQ